jgi:hypothetical protein
MKDAMCRIPDGSDCAAPDDSAPTMSDGIGATTHRIPAHKMPQRTPRIPPLAWGTQGPRPCGCP